MRSFKRPVKTVLSFVGFFSSLFFISSSAHAGGFQLWEQDASGVGDYHAGAAAEGDRAASEFFNPASVTRLKKAQVSAGAALIAIDVRYTGTAQVFITPSIPFPTFSVTDEPGGTVNAAPNFHVVFPFANRWAFAFGVTTPFGLATNYRDGPSDAEGVWRLATQTKLQTINLNPSLAYSINRYLSVAAGFDVLYGEADYDSDVFEPLVSKLSGWNCGYNLGTLIQFTPLTRVGMSYRSAITIDAKGDSKAGSFTGKTSAKFPLPATTIFSLYHTVNSRLSVMTSVFYTQWSAFKQLVLKELATPTGVDTIAINENYRDTWNFAVGGQYEIDQHISIEAGFGHDDTPTQIGYRDIRLPDNDRWVLSFGLNITPTPGFHWSIGWTHLFAPTTTIDNSQSYDAGNSSGSSRPSISVGSTKSNINVFGIQFSCDV